MAACSGLSTAATAVRAGGRPCRELERIIAERYTSGSLRPKDVLQLFDELLPRARSKSVIAFNKLQDSWLDEALTRAVLSGERGARDKALRAPVVHAAPAGDPKATRCTEEKGFDARAELLTDKWRRPAADLDGAAVRLDGRVLELQTGEEEVRRDWGKKGVERTRGGGSHRYTGVTPVPL
jgi:hypothetical protein